MTNITIKDEAFGGLRGNKLVKSSGQKVYTTKDEAKQIVGEIIHCMEDIVYFAENYFTIVSYKGKEIIKLYPKQEELLRQIAENQNTIVLAARQAGKCLFHDAKIKIRNKKSNEIEEISIGDFYNRLK